MLISALCDYYDILLSKNLVLPEGYSRTNISFVISLSENGEITEIIDFRQKEEETFGSKTKTKYIDRPLAFPQRESKSAINSEYIDHRAEYIFGLQLSKGKNNTSSFSPAIEKHKKFVEKNLLFIEGIDDTLVNAYRMFLQNWNPLSELENGILIKLASDFSKGFAFCLSGRPDGLLQDNEKIIQRWEEKLSEINSEASRENVAQCAVTGELLPIARLHSQITGIKGAQSSGSGIVSFNNKSEESYGKEQSFNSNISEKAMKKYTEALRYLLSSKLHHSTLDDLHLVHWAASGNEICDDFFNVFMSNEKMDAMETDQLIKKVFDKVSTGNAENADAFIDEIDPDVTFYVVGFKPNAARLSIKFINRCRFGTIVENMYQHTCDMKLNLNDGGVPLWQIKNELISPKSSSDNIDPSLMTRILDAIINGVAYPTELISLLIKRIRTDKDLGPQSERTRIRVLKAIINRNNRRAKKEEITMALDKDNTNSAYLCGRLFAVLEGIQQKSAGYSLNRTIKDTYFSAASVRPASTFPKLLRLSQFHLAKIDRGSYRENEIMEIMEALGQTFPTSLCLMDQGIFMLGYYQQKAYTEEIIKQYKTANN